MNDLTIEEEVALGIADALGEGVHYKAPAFVEAAQKAVEIIERRKAHALTSQHETRGDK